jgi:hypothetical protein
VGAAIENQSRRVRRLLVTHDEERARPALDVRADHPGWERVGREEMERQLPQGAIHQGLRPWSSRWGT